MIPLQAQCGREGRWGIALLFHDRSARREWVVSSTPQPHFTTGKIRYPFYRRLGGPQGRSGGAKVSNPLGFNPQPSSLYSLAILTELLGPQCRRQSTNMKIAKKTQKRGKNWENFIHRKIKRSSEKINKQSMDMGRWNRDMTWIRGNGAVCTNEVKEESRHVHGNVQSNMSPT